MSSIQRDANGNATIQFTGPDKKRRTIRLGRMSERNVTRFDERLDQLIRSAKLGTALDDDTAAWVTTKLGDDMAEKLASYGLPTRRLTSGLGPFLEGFVKLRSDVKLATATFYGHTKRNLLEFFKADRPLRDITEGDAEEFRLWLLSPKKAGGQGCRTTRFVGVARLPSSSFVPLRNEN
jgi:hypothetical protein